MADEAAEAAEATEGTEEEEATEEEDGGEEEEEEGGGDGEEGEATKGDDEQIVKETSYTSGGTGSAGEGSLVSNIPLSDDAILDQLKQLDAQAKERAAKIQLMRESIERYQQADVLADDVAEKLEQKQKDLIAELQSFDRITAEIQRLIGLAEASGLSLPCGVGGISEALKAPPAKEVGYVASGIPGSIAEYLTDRTPRIVTATFRDGIPQVIFLDCPRKGGASQPLPVEGLEALARKNKKIRSQRIARRRSPSSVATCPPSRMPSCPPPPVDLGAMLKGKFRCLQAEIDVLRDENGKLNKLIGDLVQGLEEKCPTSCYPEPCHAPPCMSPCNGSSTSSRASSCWEPPCVIPPCGQPPCRPPPCRPPPSPPCQEPPCQKKPASPPCQDPCLKPPCRQPPCSKPPCLKPPPCQDPPCSKPPCRPPPCPKPPCLKPTCRNPPCGEPPCRDPPCVSPPPLYRPPCPPKSCRLPPSCFPPSCRPPPCPPPPCPPPPCPSKNLCPAYLAQQMDKLDQELQELQQMLACERMEMELDKLKQLKDSSKAVPCALLPRRPPKSCCK